MNDDRKWESRLFAATMALAALAEVLVVANGQGHHVRVQEEQACVAALDALGQQVGDEQRDNMALLAIAEQRCREGPRETGSEVVTVPGQSPSLPSSSAPPTVAAHLYPDTDGTDKAGRTECP